MPNRPHTLVRTLAAALLACAAAAQGQTFPTTTPVPALVPDAAGGSDGAVCASPGWTEFQIPVSGVTAPIT